MKRLLQIILLLHATTSLVAQSNSDSTVSLDILRAPSSPAANLLSISNSQIDRPSDPTAFMASINQASSNFSSLPSSFAIDFAPAWVWWGKKITFDKYISDKVKYSIPQTLVVSFATKSTDSLGEVVSQNPYLTKTSVGLKISIFRGHTIDQELLNAAEAKKIELLGDIEKAKEVILKEDKEYKSLKTKLEKARGQHNQTEIDQLQESLKQKENEINTRVTGNDELGERFNELKDLEDKIKLTRYGFKLDLAAGLVFDFLKQNFNNGKLTKSAAWLTGGWDTKSGITALLIARYQYNPDQIFADENKILTSANNSSFDGGARLIYSNTAIPLSFSSEAIYRSVLNNTEVKPSWRISINAEYDIGKNKKLTFVFGRDFDGTVTKDGNLIAALNLLFGFGSKKEVL